MGRNKKWGLSFSWKRAGGLSAAKQKASRELGVPLTRSGRQRKFGRGLGCCIPLVCLLAGAAAVYVLTACPAAYGQAGSTNPYAAPGMGTGRPSIADQLVTALKDFSNPEALAGGQVRRRLYVAAVVEVPKAKGGSVVTARLAEKPQYQAAKVRIDRRRVTTKNAVVEFVWESGDTVRTREGRGPWEESHQCAEGDIVEISGQVVSVETIESRGLVKGNQPKKDYLVRIRLKNVHASK